MVCDEWRPPFYTPFNTPFLACLLILLYTVGNWLPNCAKRLQHAQPSEVQPRK